MRVIGVLDRNYGIINSYGDQFLVGAYCKVICSCLVPHISVR
jgi:hypothetical protein